MFARLPVRICGEVQLRIHHNLLAKCPRAEVQEVFSKPQALSQCRDWLSKHLPWARVVEMNSTAAAAQLAAGKPGAAAIASREAAASYGLEVVAADIEDNKGNFTRFAIIGGEAAPRTGQDKTALMFEIPHRPGSLADVMGVFKRGRLNLTWIESFPLLGTPNEYLFFVELEGHHSEARVQRASGRAETTQRAAGSPRILPKIRACRLTPPQARLTVWRSVPRMRGFQPKPLSCIDIGGDSQAVVASV